MVVPTKETPGSLVTYSRHLFMHRQAPLFVVVVQHQFIIARPGTPRFVVSRHEVPPL